MPKKDDSNWSRVSGAGLEIGAGVGLGAAIGAWIDAKWHSNPWGVLVGCSIGFVAGMYLLIKAAMKANRD